MKQIGFKSSALLLVISVLVACAPDSRQLPSEAKTTYSPKKPVITEGDSYRLARGATRIDKMDVSYDVENRSMNLKGRIEYLDLKDSRLRHLDLDLVGVVDKNGFAVLKSTGAMVIETRGLQVAAKATCLGADLSCIASFIDIYLYLDGVVYHHQIEHDQSSEIESPEQSETPDEENGYEVGSDGVDGEPGPYVGSVLEDIRSLLDWNLISDETPKSEQPKSEEQPGKGKKDEKIEDPKPQEPKREEPAPQEPKKEEPPRQAPPESPEDKKKEEPPAVGSSLRVEDIPKANQAIGAVNAGRLENAANLLSVERQLAVPGFKVISPERLTHFGANELIYIIQLMGKVTEGQLPGYKLAIGNLSRERGGRLSVHKSHQNGLDVDGAFYFKNKTFEGRFASAVAVNKPHPDWLPEQQWELFKEVVKTRLVDRIFIHQALKKSLCEIAIKKGELQKGKNDSLAFETLRRLIPENNHHNHFHLRVKCSSAQVRCRQMAEPVANSGCF